MPIDPNIIAGLRPAQIQQRDPMEAYSKSLALQGLMRRGELEGLQAEQARMGIDDSRKLRGVYDQAGGDNARLRALLPSAGPMGYKALQDMDKAQLEAEAKRAGIGKDNAAAGKSTYDTKIGQIQHISSVLAEVQKNPALYPAARRELAMTFGPEMIAGSPEQYDPDYVASRIAMGQTLAQRLTDERAREANAQTAANAPFTPGPNGPVPNVPAQQFMLDKARKSAPNVTVKTDVKTGESLAGQVGPMMKDSVALAEGAVKQVDAANRIVNAVDSNKLFTGPLANQRVTMAQVGQMMGVGGKDDAEKLANTRGAIRGLAELTLQGRQQMRGQGAITESEGKLAEKAMSGDISELTAAEVRQLARASERAARFNHTEHMRKLKVMQENPALTGIAPFYQGPSMPAEIPDPVPAAPAGASSVRSQADAILNGGRR